MVFIESSEENNFIAKLLQESSARDSKEQSRAGKMRTDVDVSPNEECLYSVWLGVIRTNDNSSFQSLHGTELSYSNFSERLNPVNPDSPVAVYFSCDGIWDVDILDSEHKQLCVKNAEKSYESPLSSAKTKEWGSYTILAIFLAYTIVMAIAFVAYNFVMKRMKKEESIPMIGFKVGSSK
ncbi:hypothetical protein B4U79_16496 [Dinothrombium tinctorium]|uniref:Uncharacterized protein n=1 Tax=Dinothrombium tinctorium TaxID=1965070 RepID=A0A3S3NJ09_9ACAR|nr:hypothetical protein B4U79_16496 [Dinothrombium tinctorium]